jgi:hypothetical protein
MVSRWIAKEIAMQITKQTDKETFERLLAVPIEAVHDHFRSIPVLKDHLYRVRAIKSSPRASILVAKISAQDIQEADQYCLSLPEAPEQQMELPSVSNLDYPHLLRFLRSLAEGASAGTIYYKRTEYPGSHVWEIEASLFDYQKGRSSSYALLEHYDQGSRTFGNYVEITKYSRVRCEVVNGYQGKAAMPPFEIPLLELIRNFELYDWNMDQAARDKLG